MDTQVVQVVDGKGSNVLQGGVAITLALNKTGLTGTTVVITATNGAAAFSNLTVTQVGNGDTLTASAIGLKSAVSSVFSITQGKTAVVLTASTNLVTYGQAATLTAAVSAVAPASGMLSGIVTFKDGSTTLGTGVLNATNQASFTTTNRLLAGTHAITATFGGSTNFAASASSASRRPATLAASGRVPRASTATGVSGSRPAAISPSRTAAAAARPI